MSGTAGDWRNGSAYDYFDALDPEQLTFEFLRRNEDYAADYAAALANPSLEMPPALARWGLRFRGRFAASGRPDASGMAPIGQPTPNLGRAAADDTV